MKLGTGITEQEWADWKAKNTDPYGARIFSYAEDWANLMENEAEHRISFGCPSGQT